MAGLIDPSDPDDPIARQFVPRLDELTHLPGERDDPIGDDAHSPVPGLVHRHPDRVLLKVTGICPVYCRFCFRREMVGPDAGRELSAADLDRAIAHIAADPRIVEVILTGGDPLVLSSRRIRELTTRLAEIPHVRLLRWHTRVPVVAPERVTPELVDALRSPRQAVWIGIHTNHPRELTPAALAAIARLADAGLPLVSQTVLLDGVNNDPDTLATLFLALVAARVKPYYLHHPDLAPGTAHFRPSIAEGQALMTALRTRITGLAVPTYVLDIPGGAAKVPIGPASLVVSGRVSEVSSPDGRVFEYTDPANRDG
jgi:lysine 2,3-aminomutase